jgi:adenylate cyclase
VGSRFGADSQARFDADIDAAIGLVDRALALNPSFARGWLFSGTLRSWAGQHNLAIEHLETSVALAHTSGDRELFLSGLRLAAK